MSIQNAQSPASRQPTSSPPSLQWSRSFTFQGREFFYNRIPFNNCNERAVEIPLAFDFLARQPQRERVLEIGNVLQHYENALSDTLGLRSRRIVDKFEVAPGVDNSDFMDIDSAEQYQAIVSISTIEHIGQTSDPTGQFGERAHGADHEAPLKAIVKIYQHLTDGGQALITVPFGQLIAGGWYVQSSSEYLALLTTKYTLPQAAVTIGILKQVARERTWPAPWSNPRQVWVEATPAEAANACYDPLWSGAQAIAVIELTKLPQPFAPPALATLPATPLAYARPRRTQWFSSLPHIIKGRQA